jgi:hypothetical protein
MLRALKAAGQVYEMRYYEGRREASQQPSEIVAAPSRIAVPKYMPRNARTGAENGSVATAFCISSIASA